MRSSLLRLALFLPLLLAACGTTDPTQQPTPVSVPTNTSAPLAPTATVQSQPTVTSQAPTATAVPRTGEVYLRPVAGAASSFDTSPGFAPTPDPMNAADGNFDTRWAPTNGLDGQWIQFDLGKSKTIDHVRIFWEEAYATSYELQVSDDAQTWRTLSRVDNGDGDMDEVKVAPQEARYLRMQAVARKFAEWGTSIWELEIYGPASANLDDRPYAEVYQAQASPTALTMAPPIAGPGAWGDKMQAGATYNSWRELEYLSPESDAALAYLDASGANAVALVPTWFQDDLSATEIAPWPGRGGRTPDDAALAHAINEAHRLGLRVMLKPHLDLRTTDWRGQINNPVPAWFASYSNFIAYYAGIAQTYGVELFCVGTELDLTFGGHQQEWRDVIGKVRSVYSGQLTYAANWPSYGEVPFWSDLDYIGIDGYWPLTEVANPTDEQLLSGWRDIAFTLNSWRTEAHLTQPIIFTELGYRSANGTNRQFAAPAETTPAPEQQAAALRAAVTVMGEQPWFRGLYYWNYLPDATTPDPAGFTVRGKPAEAVLFDAFHRWAARP